jgi:hypothetical protein
MTAKIHINLSQGVLEVEGEPNFVRSIYDDFKGQLSAMTAGLESKGKSSTVAKTEKHVFSKEVSSDNAVAKDKGSLKKKSSSKTPSFLKDLNLFKEGSKPSLKDFITGYDIPSNFARNLLFVHYLKEIKELESVGIDEIYTCYKNLGLKIPNIKQGLIDTGFRKGWLDTASLSDLKITVAGENAISHELIKSQAVAA